MMTNKKQLKKIDKPKQDACYSEKILSNYLDNKPAYSLTAEDKEWLNIASVGKENQL